MKQPSEMSNAELNLAIALMLDDTGSFKKAWGAKGHDRYWVAECLPRYCTNIADIFPIMIELGICFNWTIDDKAQAHVGLTFRATNKDPIRSICECVLLVLREKE